MLDHSYRTFAFGAALGEWMGLDVDLELLFAAALLHDIGLTTTVDDVDPALASAVAARDVAEQVGLSTAATDILLSALTLHSSCDVTQVHGEVADLISAGIALDVAIAAASRG